MEFYCFVVFAIFVIFSAAFPCNIGGHAHALAASRQYLPVAVQVDVSSYQTPRYLRLKEIKAQPKSNFTKDESENLLKPKPERDALQDEFRVLTSPQNDSASSVDNSTLKDDLVKLSTLALTDKPPMKDSKQNQSKRPRRRRLKDRNKLVFHQNINWNLRTINDKPAEIVLAQDKASQPRLLSDTTESSLVMVKRLKQ